MKIIRAEHLGMCFGVKDAVALALETANREPLTILGDLVHNETVLSELREKGVRVAQKPGDITTQTVMVTAHGAAERAKNEARGRGFNVVEATCPLVHAAHHAVVRLVSDGFHPVIIGKRDHVEVRGLTGDLSEFDVVLNEEDVLELVERPGFGLVAQTTQPIDRVRQLVGLMRNRFPKSEIRFVDTVCQPTKQRQNAAVELAQKCDVVIVIGGAHSNNTHELVRTCSRHCGRVHHVQTAADLREEWFRAEDIVGLTAGTSTPDSTIAATERWLQELASAHLSTADTGGKHELRQMDRTFHAEPAEPGGTGLVCAAQYNTAHRTGADVEIT